MKTSSKQLTDDALAPVLRWLDTQPHGTRATLLQRLNKRLSVPLDRSSFDRYLRREPLKRMEPRLGLGLLLLEEWRKMR